MQDLGDDAADTWLQARLPAVLDLDHPEQYLPWRIKLRRLCARTQLLSAKETGARGVAVPAARCRFKVPLRQVQLSMDGKVRTAGAFGATRRWRRQPASPLMHALRGAWPVWCMFMLGPSLGASSL